MDFGNVGNAGKTITFSMKADDTTSRKIINIDGTKQIELNGSSQITATNFPAATVYVDGHTGNAIPDNDWHHVAVTDVGGINASTLEFGRVGESYFDGTLDNIRIYDRVLSTEEIFLLGGQRSKGWNPE